MIRMVIITIVIIIILINVYKDDDDNVNVLKSHDEIECEGAVTYPSNDQDYMPH